MMCPQCAELELLGTSCKQNEEYKGTPVWTCDFGHRFGWVKVETNFGNMEAA